ncbi:lysophospholipid acyltransferase family protein [Thermophagus sp. OGC60D27]|uniref:lysophospholipid acyltransferase family protein n=1 Tax=Thermophagus sp. OGC60D27 TaxID=3458415 RepID=UPI0040375F92
MIKARHHPFFVYFFQLYVRVLMRLHFRRVEMEGDLTLHSKSPLLIVSNHFSWWDGFIILYLNQKWWNKKFHVMMLEEQLINRKFLSRIGAFSIKRHHPSSIRSVRYALDILRDPNNLLLIYPQGDIHSLHQRPLKFQAGAEFFLSASEASLKMVVVLVDYFSSPRPSLYIYVKDLTNESSQQNLEQAFNNFMNECIQKQSKHEKAGH